MSNPVVVEFSGADPIVLDTFKLDNFGSPSSVSESSLDLEDQFTDETEPTSLMLTSDAGNASDISMTTSSGSVATTISYLDPSTSEDFYSLVGSQILSTSSEKSDPSEVTASPSYVWNYTDPFGLTYTYNYTYDQNGNLTDATLSDSFGVSSSIQNSINYDDLGNAIGFTTTTNFNDPSGTSYEIVSNYDADWNLVSSRYSDSTGNTTTNRYDTLIGPDGSISGYSQYVETSDAIGNGYSQLVQYDANWDVTSSFYLDNFGNLSTARHETLLNEDGTISGYAHSYEYSDASGSGYTSSVLYDADWNVTSYTYGDSNGGVTTTRYETLLNSDGSISGYSQFYEYSDASGSGYTSSVHYDANWNVTSSTYADSNGSVTTNRYETILNSDGSISGYSQFYEYSDASGTQYQYSLSYDLNGNLISYEYGNLDTEFNEFQDGGLTQDTIALSEMDTSEAIFGDENSFVLESESQIFIDVNASSSSDEADHNEDLIFIDENDINSDFANLDFASINPSDSVHQDLLLG